jgi:6-phosphofructokinase 1
MGTDMLFMIGGNGTMRAARSIVEEIAKRRRAIAVVVLPKTIDDDIAFIDKSFGFDTAVERARDAIDAAHAEAASARNGIAVVKLMGRDAGFVAANAAIASGEANFVLLPESPFDTTVFLQALDERLRVRGHAVIVIAEGCAKQLCADGAVRDASGNARYVSRGLDVGPALCDAIERYFDGRPITLKYIDPSYTIRATRAIASDALYGAELARHAVHAAMAGHTDVTVGRCHGIYVRLPLELVVTNAPIVASELRGAVREHTGQFEENQHARP